MAKNYIQPGNVIDVTAAAALTSGVAFTVGALLAVPVTDAAIGDTVAAHIEGVWELPKLSTMTIAAGDKLMWDVSTGKFSNVTAATGDLVGCAVAIAPAANGAATVLAKLLPGAASVTA
jgi:predicted RecA/RadA family phage recombinase